MRYRLSIIVRQFAQIDGWMEMSFSELRQLPDTAAKYGIGRKHLHSGDEDGEPLRSGVIILPPLASAGNAPNG